MSDEGEKTCPLCAEEMDLTDQQLKPCKCGYEVCDSNLCDLLCMNNINSRCYRFDFPMKYQFSSCMWY